MFEVEPDSARHGPEDVVGVDLHRSGLAIRLLNCSDIGKPGEAQVERRLRGVAGQCEKAFSLPHVEPEPVPQAGAVSDRNVDQGRQRPAAAKAGSMPGAARRRVDLQGEQRQRRALRAKPLDVAALDEVVTVVLDGIFTRRLDQQAADVDTVIGLQASVLHETWAIAVEDEGRFDGCEPFA